MDLRNYFQFLCQKVCFNKPRGLLTACSQSWTASAFALHALTAGARRGLGAEAPRRAWGRSPSERVLEAGSSWCLPGTALLVRQLGG